jgi:hypothetical protein
MAAVDFYRVPGKVHAQVARSFEPVLASLEFDRDEWKPGEAVKRGPVGDQRSRHKPSPARRSRGALRIPPGKVLASGKISAHVRPGFGRAGRGSALDGRAGRAIPVGGRGDGRGEKGVGKPVRVPGHALSRAVPELEANPETLNVEREPQPQVDFTCGLSNLKPEPSMLST